LPRTQHARTVSLRLFLLFQRLQPRALTWYWVQPGRGEDGVGRRLILGGRPASCPGVLAGIVL